MRVDDRGRVTAIGLLLRVSDDGRIMRELVSGRVLHHERLRDAILRHVEKDLGPMALPRVPVRSCSDIRSRRTSVTSAGSSSGATWIGAPTVTWMAVLLRPRFLGASLVQTRCEPQTVVGRSGTPPSWAIRAAPT